MTLSLSVGMIADYSKDHMTYAMSAHVFLPCPLIEMTDFCQAVILINIEFLLSFAAGGPGCFGSEEQTIGSP